MPGKSADAAAVPSMTVHAAGEMKLGPFLALSSARSGSNCESFRLFERALTPACAVSSGKPATIKRFLFVSGW